MPRRGRRGYPVAVLIGLDNEGAHTWLVYSEAVKADRIIHRAGGSDYNFYEEVVASLRLHLPEGFAALILASNEKSRTAAFMEHIKKRHEWITHRVSLRELSDGASTITDVTRLIKDSRLQESVAEASAAGALLRSDELERALESGSALYTIEELEKALQSHRRIRAILIIEAYDKAHRFSRQYQSVTQRARNFGTQVLILRDDSPTGVRVAQLGGLAAILI